MRCLRFLLAVASIGCGDILHATNWNSLCERDPTNGACPGADDVDGGAGGAGGTPPGVGGADLSSGSGTGASGSGRASSSGSGTGGGAGSGGAGGGGDCTAQYGALPGYVLCEETAETCTFAVSNGFAATCSQACAAMGGECLAAWDTEGECPSGDEVASASCESSDVDGTCSCTKQ